MLKKFVFVLLLMMFNVCFAAGIPQAKQVEYKYEIEAFAANRLPEIKREVNQEFWHAKNMHNLYQIYEYTTNKHQYVDKLEERIRVIDSVEGYFYLDLINITDKYVRVKKDIPQTDSPEVLYDYILPYLKSAKVNLTNINEVYSYTLEITSIIQEYINETY